MAAAGSPGCLNKIPAEYVRAFRVDFLSLWTVTGTGFSSRYSRQNIPRVYVKYMYEITCEYVYMQEVRVRASTHQSMGVDNEM